MIHDYDKKYSKINRETVPVKYIANFKYANSNSKNFETICYF